MVEGTTEPFATVIVAGHFIPADADGKFQAFVLLPATGANVVVIEVKDAAGNSAQESLNVALDTTVADDFTGLLAAAGVAAALAVGLAVAGLSVTGVVIWARKRRSRVLAEQRLRSGSQAVA